MPNGGPPPPPPGSDKEAERPGKIKTSFAHTRGRSRKKPKKRPMRKSKYRLPSKRA